MKRDWQGIFKRSVDKSRRPADIQKLLEQSVRRRWHYLAEERLDTVEPVIPIGKTFWALSRQERAGLRDLFEHPDVQTMITELQGRDGGDKVSMVDAAYWMKGCSSLGRLRYAAMLRVGTGEDSTLCLVDIKKVLQLQQHAQRSYPWHAITPCALWQTLRRFHLT